MESEHAYLRTELLQRISHELRGPTGVALGALDELELALGPAADLVRPLLLMARRSAKRILRTAEKLQRTGQIEAAQVEWNNAPLALEQLIAEAIAEAQSVEPRKGINVTFASTGPSVHLSVDAGWLLFAITELVINGIRHARSKVTVAIEAHGQPSAPGTAMVGILVDDDGSGFVEGGNRARFQPPPQRRGLGLSLPLVRDLARAYGGALVIEQRDGEPSSDRAGAKARLVLPTL